ncbi:receptor-like kinase [Trifolium pratense]|uniref:Receptor-like kinase n=1 Tax=Trifolium pratense TaxID=57577 RepID=A0A2K3M2E4_TRIPR|nr:receptor-like kinase [Trifolium pratense]
MWFRVLAARYGVEGGRLRDGGRHGSVWWREIASIREGGEGSGGNWFGDHVVKRVGDGSDTLFWIDPWLGETPLRERFGRLLALAETKQCTVAEMFSLGWGFVGEAWVWRRSLRAWEEELLRECQILLSNISLQAQSPDRWQWRLDPDTGYTVRGAYQFLTSIDLVTMDDAENLIWHPQVPLKVSVLAWRLLRDRLPTKTNLVTRGILSPAAHFCVSGCGEAESAQHLFISCSTSGSLWTLVCTWIDISPAVSTFIRDHFVQFTSSASGSRARRSFLQVI